MIEYEPIYYVVVETDRNNMGYLVYRVLKVIPCTMGDLNRMHANYVAPYIGSARNVTSMLFTRQASTVFLDGSEDGIYIKGGIDKNKVYTDALEDAYTEANNTIDELHREYDEKTRGL